MDDPQKCGGRGARPTETVLCVTVCSIVPWSRRSCFAMQQRRLVVVWGKAEAMGCRGCGGFMK